MKPAVVFLVLSLGLLPHFENAVGQDHWGFCSEYQRPPTFCTTKYNPICGNNGKTYSNKCMFCKAVFDNLGGLCFERYGEC